jgi:hypothetical protein
LAPLRPTLPRHTNGYRTRPACQLCYHDIRTTKALHFQPETYDNKKKAYCNITTADTVLALLSKVVRRKTVDNILQAKMPVRRGHKKAGAKATG